MNKVGIRILVTLFIKSFCTKVWIWVKEPKNKISRKIKQIATKNQPAASAMNFNGLKSCRMSDSWLAALNTKQTVIKNKNL